MNSLMIALVRFGMSIAYRLHRFGRSIGFATREGAHAIAFTSARKVILIKLTYAPGWRIPGGGLQRGETGVEACIRELQEEIGLIRYSRIIDLGCTTYFVGRKSHVGNLIAIFNVEYIPNRWSLEVEKVIEVNFDDLPKETTDFTRRALKMLEAKTNCLDNQH